MELNSHFNSMKISMNDTAPTQHGKGFLNDLRNNNNNSNNNSNNSSVFPNVAAHAWNVNVPDFVPTHGGSSGGGAGGGNGSASGSSGGDSLMNPVMQLLTQSVASQTSGDRDKCDQYLNNCIGLLYSGGQLVTHDLLFSIVKFVIDLGKNNQANCDAAASVLAFLALNFHVSDSAQPQLLQAKLSSLGRHPLYIALMRYCNDENERIRKAIMHTRVINNEQANYILLFSYLYVYLPSVMAQSERQSALAKEILLYLRQLADLHNCQLAYSTMHCVLMQVGVPLDVDCADSVETIEQENAQLLTTVYELLRSAIANGRIGNASVAMDLIRLLELRSSGWNRNPGLNPDFPPNTLSSANSIDSTQNMTDDMYADYEQFLRESGQL